MTFAAKRRLPKLPPQAVEVFAQGGPTPQRELTYSKGPKAVRQLLMWRGASSVKCDLCEKRIWRRDNWIIVNMPGEYIDAAVLCGKCGGEMYGSAPWSEKYMVQRRAP